MASEKVLPYTSSSTPGSRSSSSSSTSFRRQRRPRWSLLTPLLILLGLLTFLWYRTQISRSTTNTQLSTIKPQQRRVPLEAHIMSKCPDALDCLRDLILPTMERVEDKVSFRLSYIGTASQANDDVACKHGPSECLGNMIELCAADVYPNPKTYLGFTMCLTRQYARIPDQDLVEDCALEHGVDFDRVNDCMSRDEDYGLKLLRESVLRTEEVGVTTSCTVRLQEKIRCIRDGGEWKDCEGGHRVEDLVRDIDRLYQG